MYICTHMYNINIMSIYIYIYIYNRHIIYVSAPSILFHIIYIGRGRGREGKGMEGRGRGERERGRGERGRGREAKDDRPYRPIIINIIMIGLYDKVRPRFSEQLGTH